ncbi:MAG: peptidoglycan-associated lipoprotein Pal [Burkholderiales bacterium]|nr:peptidoglycan-associated lipoprotein Pal [Burkholderiales bacterium]
MHAKLRLALAAASLVALAACSSVKLDDGQGAPIESRTASGSPGSGSPGSGTPGTDPAASTGAGSRQITPVQSESKSALDDPAGVLARRSIYFDFDQYTIRDEFKGVIEAHGQFLIANKNRKVIIQGNTDERGSREYNLALGQKRSEAVRKALMAVGVADTQLEAVSLGEEKPKANGGDEAAMAENRRADLVYQ